jgi:hypothetical protein
VFTVRLAGKDLLPTDDEASIVSSLPRPAKVLLVTLGNRLLEKALRAAPAVELTVTDNLTGPATGFDLVVLDGVEPVTWPDRNVLAIKVHNSKWVPEVQSLEAPAIVDWRSSHPVLRYAGFDNVQILQSLAAKTPSWAVSLVDAPQASLMLAGDLARQRVVWVGFDILESNWPLRVSFPIFIANAVEWLNPANEKGGQLLVRTGDPFRLALAEPQKTARVRLPGGETASLQIDPKATELVFGETGRRGTYRLSLATNEVTFCVNLLDAFESNIKPKEELQLGKYTKVAATTVQRANMEVWRSIAGIGLLLLLFEWWYYHRRTV